MKKFLALIGLLFIQSVIAQDRSTILEYPNSQAPYKGGYTKLFADIQDVIVSQKMEVCLKPEAYWVRLKIDENSKPALIKNTEKAKNNPCAYNTIVKALGQLKDWQSAIVEGKTVSAYVDFPFYTQDFFQNYKQGYNIFNHLQKAEVEGGINQFKEQLYHNFHAYVDYDVYIPNGKFIFSFDIDEKGKISNIGLEPKVKNSDRMLEDLKFALKKIKSKWSPALVDGKPVASKYKFPIKFITTAEGVYSD